MKFIREVSLTAMRQMLKQDARCDWNELWAIGSTYGCSGTKHLDKPEAAPPTDKIATNGFRFSDVKTILASVNGENNSQDWVCMGQLKDKRYFVVRGGCDYSGWG